MSTVVPAAGQVWEFLVEASTDTFKTLDFNRVRWVLSATNPANPIDPGAATPFLTQMHSRWQANMLPLLCSTYNITRYNAQCIISSTPQPGHPTKPAIHYDGRIGQVPSPAEKGGDLTPPNPSFVTARILFGSTTISRNTRGGLSMSPIPDAAADGDTLTLAARTAWDAAATAFLAIYIDGASNATWAPVIFSGRLALSAPMGVNYVNAVNFSAPLTVHTTVPNLRSQLHRKLRGAN